MKNYNLSEITKNVAFKQVQLLDSSLKQYIISAVELLKSQGKDITDYSLIQVQNPMEVIDSGLRVTSQWRIIEVSKLQNEEL